VEVLSEQAAAQRADLEAAAEPGAPALGARRATV
jgi:hypothetical protein